MTSSQNFADQDLSGRTIGDFQILAKLGRGGMGVVYQAVRLDAVAIPVAIKYPLFDVGNAQALERFYREMKIHSGLKDPRIASINEVGVHTIDGVDRPYYVMAFIDGVTLQRFLAAQNEPLPINVSVFLLLELAKALRYLHHIAMEGEKTRRIAHRDLSPDNIMLQRPTAEFHLMDFGVASSVSEFSAVPSLVGKIRYTAPESIECAEQTTKVDIWAAGAIAWELLHNRKFLGDLLSPPQIYKAITDHELPPVDEHLPAELAGLLDLMLDEDPDERPSAADLVMRLVEFTESHGIKTERTRLELASIFQSHYGTRSSSGKTGALKAATKASAKISAEQLAGALKPEEPTAASAKIGALAASNSLFFANAIESAPDSIRRAHRAASTAETVSVARPKSATPSELADSEFENETTAVISELADSAFESETTAVIPRTTSTMERQPTVIRLRRPPAQPDPDTIITPNNREVAAVSGEVEGETRQHKIAQPPPLLEGAQTQNDATPTDPREILAVLSVTPTAILPEMLPPRSRPRPQPKPAPLTQPNRDTVPDLPVVEPSPKLAPSTPFNPWTSPLAWFALVVVAIGGVVIGYLFV